MAQGNQMHMVTESAQRAQTVAGGTADGLHGHVTRLTGEVGSVIGSGWVMDQATAFHTAHTNWADGMGRLITALNMVATDTGANVNDYVANDQVLASSIGKVQAPPFSGVL